MDIEEVILLIEKIKINQTGKVLSTTDAAVIRGLYETMTYWAIAEKYNFNEGYVGEKSRAIFRLLSTELGYTVTKHNFRWVIDRIDLIKSKKKSLKDTPPRSTKIYRRKA